MSHAFVTVQGHNFAVDSTATAAALIARFSDRPLGTEDPHDEVQRVIDDLRAANPAAYATMLTRTR